MPSKDVKTLSRSAGDAHLGKPQTNTDPKETTLARKYGFPVPDFKRLSPGREANQDYLSKVQDKDAQRSEDPSPSRGERLWEPSREPQSKEEEKVFNLLEKYMQKNKRSLERSVEEQNLEWKKEGKTPFTLREYTQAFGNYMLRKQAFWIDKKSSSLEPKGLRAVGTGRGGAHGGDGSQEGYTFNPTSGRYETPDGRYWIEGVGWSSNAAAGSSAQGAFSTGGDSIPAGTYGNPTGSAEVEEPSSSRPSASDGPTETKHKEWEDDLVRRRDDLAALKAGLKRREEELEAMVSPMREARDRNVRSWRNRPENWWTRPPTVDPAIHDFVWGEYKKLGDAKWEYRVMFLKLMVESKKFKQEVERTIPDVEKLDPDYKDSTS